MNDQKTTRMLQLAYVNAQELLKKYPSTMSLTDKSSALRKEPLVISSMCSYPQLEQYLALKGDVEFICFALMALLKQLDHVLYGLTKHERFQEALEGMGSILSQCEYFYAPIGGLLGYYVETLHQMMSALHILPYQMEEQTCIQYEEAPCSTDVCSNKTKSWNFSKRSCIDQPMDNNESRIKSGVISLSKIALLFPVGGAGERLGLIDEVTKEPLPVAFLSFLGRPLLEHLFRDTEALEYLYEKCFSRPCSIPIILMDSYEQLNNKKIERLLEQNNYFHKSKNSICTMTQPLVPLFDLEGNFALTGPMTLLTRPGGHGVVWRLAYLSNVFEWLNSRGVEHLLIRQINNPLAGVDDALLTMLGIGVRENKAFGFAACSARSGLAEGRIVLKIVQQEIGRLAGLSNLEYTGFDSLLKHDPSFFTRVHLYANTNILYANCHIVQNLAKKIVAPGMLINMKGQFSLYEKGQYLNKKAVRLESTMQNISDSMYDQFGQEEKISSERLSTFLAVFDREKLFSVTKKALLSLKEPHETPEACVYDWYKMVLLLLKSMIKTTIPEEQTFEQFVEHGPNLLFYFHPALGPLWALIRQKIQHVHVAPFAEFEIELAEVSICSFSLDGSFSVRSTFPCGQKGYPESVPRFSCVELTIRNEGIERPTTLKKILKRAYKRKELCEFVLEEGAELVIEHVMIQGDFLLKVPAYTRMVIGTDPVTGKMTVNTFQKKKCS